MAQYLVLKELPKGQQPGELVELNDDEARVFMTEGVEAVRPVDPEPDETKPRRRYNRRDLQATED